MTDKRLGYYSQEIQLARPDGRTREGRLVVQVRQKLIEALGGLDRVTPGQRTLIERAAMLQLRLAVMDKKTLAGDLTLHDTREYLSATNALGKIIEKLGLARPPAPEPPPKPDPMAVLAAHIAARRAADSEAA